MTRINALARLSAIFLTGEGNSEYSVSYSFEPGKPFTHDGAFGRKAASSNDTSNQAENFPEQDILVESDAPTVFECSTEVSERLSAVT